LWTEDVVAYYPWKKLIIPGPKDPKIVTQTKLLSIIWI